MCGRILCIFALLCRCVHVCVCVPFVTLRLCRCLCVCVCVYVIRLRLCLCACVLVCLCVCVCVRVRPCVLMSMHLPGCLSVSGSVCLCTSLSLFLFLSLCLCLCGSMFVCLRDCISPSVPVIVCVCGHACGDPQTQTSRAVRISSQPSRFHESNKTTRRSGKRRGVCVCVCVCARHYVKNYSNTTGMHAAPFARALCMLTPGPVFASKTIRWRRVSYNSQYTRFTTNEQSGNCQSGCM